MQSCQRPAALASGKGVYTKFWLKGAEYKYVLHISDLKIYETHVSFPLQFTIMHYIMWSIEDFSNKM